MSWIRKSISQLTLKAKTAFCISAILVISMFFVAEKNLFTDKTPVAESKGHITNETQTTESTEESTEQITSTSERNILQSLSNPSWTFWVLAFFGAVGLVLITARFGEKLKNRKRAADQKKPGGDDNGKNINSAAGNDNSGFWSSLVEKIDVGWKRWGKSLYMFPVYVYLTWLLLTQVAVRHFAEQHFDWIWSHRVLYWVFPALLSGARFSWAYATVPDRNGKEKRKSVKLFFAIMALGLILVPLAYGYRKYFEHPASEDVKEWIAEREAKKAEKKRTVQVTARPKKYEACWQKPPEVKGYKPEIRQACYDAYIIRDDEFVFEFIVVWIDNYETVKARLIWDKTSADHGTWSQPTPKHNPLHGDWWLAPDGRGNYNGWIRDRSRPEKERQEKMPLQLRVKLAG